MFIDFCTQSKATENTDTSIEQESASRQSQLIIDKPIAVYLMETRKWGKFLAVVGFIGVGMMVLIGLGMMTFFSTFMPANANMPFSPGFLGIFYVLIAVMYYFPSLYLLRFSNKTKLALNNLSQEELTAAFQNLKSVFKFFGVMTLIVFILYAVILIGAMIGGAIGALS